MTDKYTELAREWIEDSHLPIDVTELASLLRRVAREQIEEDAGVAVGMFKEDIITDYWKGYDTAARNIDAAIRSRLED